MKALRITLVILVLLSKFSYAQRDSSNYFYPKLRIDIPLMDVNHWRNAAYTGVNHLCTTADCQPNFGDWAFSIYKNPSMFQATALNLSAEQTTAWASQLLSNRVIKPKTLTGKAGNILVSQFFSAISTLVILQGLPFGQSWLHEEYHRSVMATNRVGSRNPFDDFSIDISNGSVSDIYDYELSRFKKGDKNSFTRMLIAGGEGELLAARGFQEYNFFFDGNLPTEMKAILYTTAFVNYFNDTYAKIDSMNIEGNRNDGSSILKRDFTGHDYSGWIWHLFKPDAPYESLGTHPSGVGINRYITSDRLNSEEKSYYENVKSKAWTNWLSPMYFGFRKIKLKEHVFVNFAVQYQPTSFGVDQNVLVYYRNKRNKWSFGYHNYQNFNNDFYSLDVSWIDKKFPSLEKWSFTSRVMLGNQPKNQEFKTGSSQFFGLASVTAYYKPKQKISFYGQLQAKSEGWVAGDEYLREMMRVRLGLRIEI